MYLQLRMAVPAVFLTGCLWGQANLSSIRGTSTDQSGAIVPGVEVSIDEVATNIHARKITTDGQGNYEVPDLKPGTYRLTAALPGFKTFVASELILASSQIRRIDIRLEVGTAETQVTVSASAAVIETEQGKISASFGGDRYKDIPIPANRYGAPTPVLALLPSAQPQAGSGSGLILAGHSGTQVDMGMDGVHEQTLNSQTINMEFVEELKLVAVNNTAEYSRIGHYNTVSKRGGNRYHGEVSFYDRNSALGARNFFEPKKTKDMYHTFNLAASGPVIKDKTFFYGLWNGERVPGKTFLTRSVPTPAMRTGNFSELLALARPVTVIDPLNRTAFPGNVIPANRLSSISQKIQDAYLPLPNLGAAGSLSNNFQWVHPYPGDQFIADVVTLRLDHKFTDRNSIFGRFTAYLPRYVNVGAYPALAGTTLRQSHSWSIVDTHVFSPRAVNSFTFGGNRDAIQYAIEVDGHQPPSGAKVVSDLGIGGVNPGGFATPGGFPTMNITGYSSIDVQTGGPVISPKSFTFADALSWSTGKHVFKFGGELRTFMTYDGRVPAGTYGAFTFDGSLSNNAYADFLLGLPYSSQRLIPFINRTTRSKELGIYVTDTFKLSNRLTLDFGLRWDFFTSPRLDDGLAYNWDPATGNIIVPQAALNKISPLYPTNTIKVVAGEVIPHAERTNFAPRLAAAYRLNDKTVLRGGYGIFNEFLGAFVRAQGTGPFQLSETFFNTIQNGRPAFAFPSPFPVGAGSIPSQSAVGYPMDTKNGYIQQFNFTIERQVKDIGFRLSYIGSRDMNLNYNLATNKPAPSLIPFVQSRRPYAQFVGTTFAQTNGRTKFNSMVFEAQRRVSWVTFDAFWTWARNMTNFANLENPYSPNLWNRDIAPKHRVVFNTLWLLPVGRGRHFLANLPGPAEHVLGGWKFAWANIMQTGQYFTPSYAGADPSNTNTSGGLPDRISSGNLPTSERSLYRWFDVGAFARPPAGRFGNSGVNVLQGPGMVSHNVSLFKRFQVTERVHMDFMAMISNLFNHPNFRVPPSNISAPGQAGIITNQVSYYDNDKGGPRVIEARVRIEF